MEAGRLSVTSHLLLCTHSFKLIHTDRLCHDRKSVVRISPGVLPFLSTDSVCIGPPSPRFFCRCFCPICLQLAAADRTHSGLSRMHSIDKKSTGKFLQRRHKETHGAFGRWIRHVASRGGRPAFWLQSSGAMSLILAVSFACKKGIFAKSEAGFAEFHLTTFH